MVKQIIGVPLSEPQFEISVFALYKGKNAGPFSYLQAARQHKHKVLGMELESTAVAATYKSSSLSTRRNWRHLSSASDCRMNLVARLFRVFEIDQIHLEKDEIPLAPVDALLSPPTDHPLQAEPYRQALVSKFPHAVDLTNCFSGCARRAKCDALPNRG